MSNKEECMGSKHLQEEYNVLVIKMRASVANILSMNIMFSVQNEQKN